MRKEIRKIEVFIATDGREFDKENDCIFYEKELGYKIKTEYLLINTMLMLPFIFGFMILPLYDKIIFWIVLSVSIITGIVSISSIIALIYRKWKK